MDKRTIIQCSSGSLFRSLTGVIFCYKASCESHCTFFQTEECCESTADSMANDTEATNASQTDAELHPHRRKSSVTKILGHLRRPFQRRHSVAVTTGTVTDQGDSPTEPAAGLGAFAYRPVVSTETVHSEGKPVTVRRLDEKLRGTLCR